MLPGRWANEERADEISIDSEVHLLPKDENETISLRPLENVITVTRVAIAVIVMILWGTATFTVGNIIGKRQQDDGPWGSFENGFVEEQVISK